MKRFFLFLLLIVLAACGEKGPQFGPYSIGRDGTWFPLDLGSKQHQFTAFTTCLIQEMGKSEHLPLQLISICWAQLFESLENGSVGGILTALPPNVITMRQYSFSNPLIELGPVLIVPTTSQATSLADFKDRIVAVYQYDESILLAQQNPAIIIRLYQSKCKVLEELVKGNVDGVLMPVLDAKALVPYIDPYRLKIVSQPLNQKAIRLITLKDKNSSLIKYFNRGLDKLQKSGFYQNLLQTFQLNDSPQ